MSDDLDPTIQEAARRANAPEVAKQAAKDAKRASRLAADRAERLADIGPLPRGIGNQPTVAKSIRRIRDSAAGTAKRADEAADRLEKLVDQLPETPIRRYYGAAPPARGNPRQFNQQRQREYLEHLRANGVPLAAAKLTGVAPEQVDEVRRVDPGFAEREQRAQEEYFMTIALEALAEQVKAGNVRAIERVLDTQSQGKWQPKAQVELSGKVTHEQDVGPAIERIALLQARLEERRALGAGPDIIDVEAEE